MAGNSTRSECAIDGSDTANVGVDADHESWNRDAQQHQDAAHAKELLGGFEGRQVVAGDIA